MSDPASERVSIVDEANVRVGAATRAEMRARHLVHRAAYILVFNGVGEIFVQKRTLTKDIFPGYYDVAAGGVVLADEDYDTGARRELAEELGIHDVPLVECFDFFYDDPRSRAWGRAYRCVWDGPIVLQAAEIASGAFQSVERALAGDFHPMTPDGEYVLRRVLAGG